MNKVSIISRPDSTKVKINDTIIPGVTGFVIGSKEDDTADVVLYIDVKVKNFCIDFNSEDSKKKQ